MKKQLIIILILGNLFCNVIAQTKNFKVFYSNGNAFVITGKQKKAAERDMTIIEGQILKLEIKTSVILVASNGTALPICLAGSYSFKNLLHLLDENNKSLTNRYFTYVVQEMTEAHEKPEDKITGGVYRAEKLMYMPFDSCLVIQNGILFSWIHGVSSELLFLTIKEKNGKTILCKPLHDTTYYYETRICNTDQVYEWSVGYDKDNFSGIATREFVVASPETVQRINTEMIELDKSLNLEPELNELIRLNFYERNHLFTEEYNTLIDVLAKYPDSNLIREYYNWFLKKH